MRKTNPIQRQALVAAVAALVAVSAHAGVPVEPQPAVAQFGVGPYVGLQGGVAGGCGGASNAGVAGLNLGYTFRTVGPIRPCLEYEGYWVRTDRSRTSASTHTVAGEEGAAETSDSAQTVRTRANTSANLVNALIRLDLGRFQPYAGFGLGFATTETTGCGRSTETDTYTTPGRTIPAPVGGNEEPNRGPLGPGIVPPPTPAPVTIAPTSRSVTTRRSWRVPSDTTTRFAVQAVAGADYHVTDRTSVFAEYRYLEFGGSREVAGLRGGFVGAGVRLHF